jgi:hypothetical protein
MMIIKDSVFFHEDNYCQIELLPIQNLFSKNNEADVTKERSEEALTDDGFITIFSRAETKYPLDKLNINITDFETELKQYALFDIKNVYTGYSSQRLLKNNIHCVGFENYILYHEFNNNIVTKAWLDYNAFSDTLNSYPESLQSALLKLVLTYDLILVDWNELITVILKNESAVTNYIKEIL